MNWLDRSKQLRTLFNEAVFSEDLNGILHALFDMIPHDHFPKKQRDRHTKPIFCQP